MGDEDKSNQPGHTKDSSNVPLSKNSSSSQSVKRPEPTPPKQK
jgi:hypothetical protein